MHFRWCSHNTCDTKKFFHIDTGNNEFVIRRQAVSEHLRVIFRFLSCLCMECKSNSTWYKGKSIIISVTGISCIAELYSRSDLILSSQIRSGLCVDGSVQQEMVLCSRNQIYATDCWQDPHFEFSRQNLNWNVQSPSMWWWLITQPRPIWKKAPAGLQRPSRTDCRISGVLYWPNPSVPHLGSDLRPPSPLE